MNLSGCSFSTYALARYKNRVQLTSPLSIPHSLLSIPTPNTQLPTPAIFEPCRR